MPVDTPPTFTASTGSIFVVIGRIAALVAVYLVINVTSSFSAAIYSRNALLLLVPTPEAGFVFALFVLSSRLKSGFRIAIHVVLIASMWILLIYGVGNTFIQTIYQRELNPWTDTAFISVGLELMFPGLSEYAEIFEVALIVVLAITGAVLSTGIAALSRRVMRPTARTSGALLFAGSTVIAGIALALAGTVIPIARHASPPKSLVLPETTLDIPGTAFQDGDTGTAGAITNARTASRTDDVPEYAFPGIRDRDVYIIFIESYGHTIFDRSELRAGLEPAITETENALVESGYAIFSGFVSSPVSGGWSWLAESTFLTGRWIDSQAKHDQLLRSEAESISRYLKRGGYFTLLSMPAVNKGEWIEGLTFYDIDERLYQQDFDYHGPWFSFVEVPDQYALLKTHQALQRLRPTENTPAYLQLVLVSTHAPFSRIPPYIEPWSDMGDGSIYLRRPMQLFDNTWLSGPEYDEGYIAAFKYELKVISYYLAEMVKGPPLIVIVGDHQPKQPVRTPEAPKSVPLHILSRDRNMAAFFSQYGYTEGIIPEQPLPHPPMDVFFTQFVEATRNAVLQDNERFEDLPEHISDFIVR